MIIDLIKEEVLEVACYENKKEVFLVWFVGFYGLSTLVGYLTPNPFLCK